MPFDEPIATTIDGVPVWFTDVPGPCMGGLVFRTGKADERLITSGINHIVEHLALHPLWDQRLDMNGHVTCLTTSFWVSGTQVQVESFLGQICRNLVSLPLDRLDDERRVLETEARSSGATFAGAASTIFGARGFGILDLIEFGLRRLGPEEIGAWAAERFTAGQAAAWITRPPTADLRLELAPGDRLPVPVPEPLPDLTLPAHIHAWETVLGCSFVAKRSLPLLIASMILRDRAMASMRLDRALTYAAHRSEERIGSGESMYFLTLDATEEQMPEAIDAFGRLLEEVAAGDVGEEELERVRAAAMPWNSTDPARPSQEAARKATACLFGREPTTWKGLEKQSATLTPEQVGAAFAEGLGSAIFVAPEGLDVPPRFVQRPVRPPTPPVIGRCYWRWDGSVTDETVLGTIGITRRVGEGSHTLLFDEIEAALLGPDGRLSLIDRACDYLLLEPNQLKGGRDLVSQIVDRLGDRVIDMRRDVVAWFELQSLVESHDPTAIRTVWREIDLLAQIREPEERILSIAFGWRGRARGIVVATDRRLLHISADEVGQVARDEITSIRVMSALRGARLVVTTAPETPPLVYDRIRPRGHGSQIVAALAPLDDD